MLKRPYAESILTLFDVLVAPAAAFARLRQRPAWGWAFVLVALLSIWGQVLSTPARTHATVGTLQVQFSRNRALAHLTAEERERIVSRVEHPGAVAQNVQLGMAIVLLLLGVLFQTLLLMTVNLCGGRASFARLWSLAMNAALIEALGAVVLGFITIERGAGTFSNATEIPAAMPGLSYVFTQAHGAAGAFLAGINVFSVWTAGVMGIALVVAARAPKAAAYSIAGAILLVNAAFPALLVGISG